MLTSDNPSMEGGSTAEDARCPPSNTTPGSPTGEEVEGGREAGSVGEELPKIILLILLVIILLSMGGGTTIFVGLIEVG